MSLENLMQEMRPAIEEELQAAVYQFLTGEFDLLRQMLTYHLGWDGEGSGPEAQGKRIRPVLLLLCTSAAGGDWRVALPAAAAVELIHNFSLIHDDIQDQSSLRRGRPTVWVKWGIAQAINAGDLMFTLAHLSILRLETACSTEIVLQAARILQQTCVDLTQGQYLDLANESRQAMPLDHYWRMVCGKTAALLAGSAEIGALTALADQQRREAFRRFGLNLGLAFQVWDDWLGIWGDVASTGKSIESDLLSGKKTLPVLYGLSQEGNFARRWKKGPIHSEEVPQLASWLVEEGAQSYVEREADRLTKEAIEALDQAAPQGEAAQALYELADWLLHRKK